MKSLLNEFSIYENTMKKYDNHKELILNEKYLNITTITQLLSIFGLNYLKNNSKYIYSIINNKKNDIIIRQIDKKLIKKDILQNEVKDFLNIQVDKLRNI